MSAPANKTSPVQFVIKALMIAAVVMWFLGAVVQPVLDEKSGESITHEAVLQQTDNLHPISGEQLVAKVQGAKPKPVMMVVYASWCGVCKASMPYILEILRETPADKRPYEVVMLSLDRSYEALSRYLLKNEMVTDYKAYIFRPVDPHPLPDFMLQMGSNFDSRIPYFAFFNAQGKLAYEFTGGMNKEMLHEALLKAL